MFKSRIVVIVLILCAIWCPSVVDSINQLDEEEDAGFEELLAVDEEELQAPQEKASEADLLSKAQSVIRSITDQNVKGIIYGNELVLVLGYAPWCHRSAELMPYFAEAATVLSEIGNPTVLAKLDAERHAKAASLLGIKGFPTLLLFVNGSAQDYSGGLTSKELVIWLRKKTGGPVIRLLSKTAAEDVFMEYEVLVLGLFKISEGYEYDEFFKAAAANNETQFVVTNSEEVAATLFPRSRLKDNFIGLIKHEPEQYVSYENAIESSKILKFVDYHKFPLVIALTESNSAKIFSSPIKLQVFIFAENNQFKKLLSILQDVARMFMSKMLFIYVDLEDDDLARPFLSLFNLEPDEPLVVAFDNNIGSKYLLGTNFSQVDLEEFCLKLLHGKLSTFYKSGPLPVNEGTVTTVVGKNFDAVVLDSAENVLLEVYTPWCLNCKAMTKLVQKISKHFQGHPDLMFARIDASSNEHPKLEVNEFPSLLFYRSGDKLNPMKIPNKSNFQGIVSLLQANVNGMGESATTSEQLSSDEL